MKKTILVIDDDESIAELLAELLESEGYNVLIAHNGEKGLKTLREVKPHLVLLDVSMPIMDGWEFKRIKDSDDAVKDIPVFVITAQADFHFNVPKGIQYISKPINIETLLKSVKSVC